MAECAGISTIAESPDGDEPLDLHIDSTPLAASTPQAAHHISSSHEELGLTGSPDDAASLEGLLQQQLNIRDEETLAVEFGKLTSAPQMTQEKPMTPLQALLHLTGHLVSFPQLHKPSGGRIHAACFQQAAMQCVVDSRCCNIILAQAKHIGTAGSPYARYTLLTLGPKMLTCTCSAQAFAPWLMSCRDTHR